MRGRFLAAFGACAVASGLASAVTPLPSAEPEIINHQVARLGADEYTERDAAGRTLEHLGLRALPALRIACRSADPEIRRRAEVIVEHIERAADNARLLSIPPIRLDYQNVPLGSAVNDLRARTKINLLLDPSLVANPLRPITVKTGDVPPWQAVTEFCRAAGLREVFLADLVPAKPEPTRYRRSYVPQTPSIPSASGVPVVLADGRPDALPGERNSAVRVLAMPSNFSANRIVLGSGEVTLNLDVTPIPNQNWQDVIGVRIKQAIDAHGRSVPASHRIEQGLSTQEQYEGNVMIINGRMALWNNDSSGVPIAAPFPNPRVVPVTLRTGDSGVKVLRLLEGSVQTEVIVPNQTLISVDQVAQVVGVPFDGPNMTRLTITDVRHEARTGQTTIKLRLESPSPWVMQQMKVRRGAVNAFGGNVFGGMVFIDSPIAPTQGPQFHVVGPDGKFVTAASTNYNAGQTDDGSRLFSEIGLTVRGGTPTKLLMIGPKTVTVDVPFRLENVPLP